MRTRGLPNAHEGDIHAPKESLDVEQGSHDRHPEGMLDDASGEHSPMKTSEVIRGDWPVRLSFVLSEFGGFESGDVKGTISKDMRVRLCIKLSRQRPRVRVQ